MDSKDPGIHVLDGWMLKAKHTQQAASTKTECDYFNGWIKKQSDMQISHPEWWTPEIQLGNAEEEVMESCLASVVQKPLAWADSYWQCAMQLAVSL